MFRGAMISLAREFAPSHRSSRIRMARKCSRIEKRHREGRHTLARPGNRTGSFSGAYFCAGEGNRTAIGRRIYTG
jgi:hypothetical protein